MAGLADHYRRHRAAFLLAQELRCTPKEAEAELRRRAARDRDQAAQRRLDLKMAAPVARPVDETEKPLPWWMND